jgi:carbon storage regulator
MLVLSRKTGERILIGDQITLTVVRIGPNNVRIGIEAPRELNIVREELCSPPQLAQLAGHTSSPAIEAVHVGG